MRTAPVLLAAVLAVLCATPAHAELQVLNKDPLAVQAKHDQDSATAVLSVLNTGADDVTASAELQARTLDSVACSGSAPVGAGAAARITITCSGLKDLDDPVKGQLVVAGAAEPVAHAATVSPALDSTAWAVGLVVVSLIFGAFLVVVVWGWAWSDADRKARFQGRAPGPKWDFADSWATTLTSAGAVFATVLTGITYPDAPQRIDEDTLIGLSLLFAAM